MRRITKDAKYQRNRRKIFNAKGFCTTCFLNKRLKGRRSCITCLEWDRKRMRLRCIRIRTETLSKYGKGRKLLCCARGCKISNIYMLTLDHIKDNGKQERLETGKLGWLFYEWLRRRGYPSGYQTLCANHQFLKEAMRRKRNWL
jgi:hypothetical protein